MRRVPLLRKSEIKRTRSLNPESAKRRRANREYAVARLVFLAEHPSCQAQLTGCSMRATQIHHILSRARGGALIDPENWLAVCAEDHRWITDHPKEATERGLLRPGVRNG